MFATRRIGEVGVCFVARVAAVLGLIESPNRFRQKQRHSGEGYRVTGDIYPPAFHVTITRTDYLSATTFPWRHYVSEDRSFCTEKDSHVSSPVSISVSVMVYVRLASYTAFDTSPSGFAFSPRRSPLRLPPRALLSPTYAPGINIRQNSSPPEVSSLTRSRTVR